jgi:hypothetical protein
MAKLRCQLSQNQRALELAIMKRNLLCALFVGIGLITSTTTTRADGDWGNGTNGWQGTCTNGNWSGTNCSNEDEGPQGGQIEGSETLIATVALTPTTNAPAGAGGMASLVSANENGISTNKCSITTTGLVAGVYTVTVVRKSNGTNVVLGQISVGFFGHGDGEDDQGEDDQGDNSQGDGESHSSEKCWNGSTNLVSVSELELPPDLDPMDVGQIILSDSSGNAILTGDFVNPTKASAIKFKASLAVQGSRSGRTQALSTVKHGKRTDRFTMIASGVAPNTKYTVYVNGKPAGTVKSNPKGNVLVKKLPANLLTVRAVRLVDGAGNTAASTKF